MVEGIPLRKEKLKLADIFTFANVSLGLLAMFFASIGNLDIAAVLLLISVLGDVLDGQVSRWTKQANEFGKQIDSLADIISFGVVPVFFSFHLSNEAFQWYALVIYAFFVICGMIRLARYNLTKFEGHFIGMPITLNGIFVPLLYYLHVPFWGYLTYFFIASWLMISNLKVKKVF